MKRAFAAAALLLTVAIAAAAETGRRQAISAKGIQLDFPPGVAVAPSNESNRAASAAAWQIAKWPDVALFQIPGDPQIGEVFVYTATSIERFDATCRRKTGHLDDPRCYPGWRPHLGDLRREHTALVRRDASELCRAPKRCRIARLAEHHWIVESTTASWGNEVSYVTYFGRTRLTLVFHLTSIGDDPARVRREAILDGAVDQLLLAGRKGQ